MNLVAATAHWHLPRPLARPTRALLVVLEGVVGVSAFFGGYGLTRDGLGMPTSWLEARSPFSDYTIPGIVLLVVVGGGMLAAAVTTWRRPMLAQIAAFGMGITLLIWLAVETVIIGFQGWEQVVLLAVYGVLAMVLIFVGASSRSFFAVGWSLAFWPRRRAVR